MAEQASLSHDELVEMLYDFFLTHPSVSFINKSLKIKGTELDLVLHYNGADIIFEVKTGEMSNGRQRKKQTARYEAQFGIRPEYYKIYVNGGGMKIFKYDGSNGKEKRIELADE